MAERLVDPAVLATEARARRQAAGVQLTVPVGSNRFKATPPMNTSAAVISISRWSSRVVATTVHAPRIPQRTLT